MKNPATFSGTNDDNLHPYSSNIEFFSEITKWAKFLFVLGFISIGGLVIIAAFIVTIMICTGGSIYYGVYSIFFSSGYVVILCIYFFPILYLYKFSNHAKKAIAENSNVTLPDFFKNLKPYYKFIGISVITFLATYIGIMLMSFVGPIVI
jgi:hypothetical protein